MKRGSSFVDNWGVSLLTAKTPPALRKLGGNLPNDGLMQRFIVAMTAMFWSLNGAGGL